MPLENAACGWGLRNGGQFGDNTAGLDKLVLEG